MKPFYTFSVLLMFAFVFAFNQTEAQLLECSSCGQADSPQFELSLNPISIMNTGPNGTTTSAQVQVTLTNTSTVNLNLVTISFSMGVNSTKVPSLTGINSDAFVNDWSQSSIFNHPDFTSILEDYKPFSQLKTFNNLSYDMQYTYNHTGSGAVHPAQFIPAGATVQVLLMELTFDGTETFQISNTGGVNYLLSPENFFIFHGECYDPDVNINNQWGFVNNFGSPLLVNCFTSNNPIPLPVELIEFTGQAYQRYNRIEWITASEFNTEWHVLERTADPTNEPFMELTRLEAAGTSESAIDYTYVDEGPLKVSYYRLKSVDFDGTYEYSDVIVLHQDIAEPFIHVYPNPADSKFTLETNTFEGHSLTVEIIDALSRVVGQYEFQTQSIGIKEQFDVSHLIPGVYIVRTFNGLNYQEVKVVKH